MHTVCKDLSSPSFSLGEEAGERSVVHKANERQLASSPWESILSPQPPTQPNGGRAWAYVNFRSPLYSPSLPPFPFHSRMHACVRSIHFYDIRTSATGFIILYTVASLQQASLASCLFPFSGEKKPTFLDFDYCYYYYFPPWPRLAA